MAFDRAHAGFVFLVGIILYSFRSSSGKMRIFYLFFRKTHGGTGIEETGAGFPPASDSSDRSPKIPEKPRFQLFILLQKKK